MYLLGKGTFGQVLCCRKPTGEKVALKVIKNRQNYYRQALFEAKILKTINKHEREEVPESLHRIVTMLDVFVWKKHLSIVFETLERNLYDLRTSGFTQSRSATSRAWICCGSGTGLDKSCRGSAGSTSWASSTATSNLRTSCSRSTPDSI